MARAKDVIHDLSEVPQCVFCGGRSTDAIWIGEQTVGVCLQCAGEVLPMLIADAVASRTNPQHDDLEDVVDQHWQIVRANFYKAVHHNDCQLLREWQEAQRGLS